MKRINFNQVQIKNFLSIGETPVVLDFKPGLHIITGINRDKIDRRNGIGKTSVIESIYFAVFGQTIRELKKDLIPNSFTNGTCQVVLDFTVEQNSKVDEYRITRTLNPTKLQFFINGVDATRDSIKNTEEDIHRVLHATPSVFENCVIMTLNNTTPFMAKSKVDKRKFIEGIFNLEIFSQMMSVVRDEYSDNKRVYEVELTKFEEADNTAKSLITQRQTILDTRSQKITTYQGRKTSNNNEKQKLIEEMAAHVEIDVAAISTQLQQLNEGIVTCDAKLEKLTELKSKVAATINQHQSTLSKIGTSASKCPVCCKPVTDHDKEQIETERATLRDQIAKLEEQHASCVVKIEDVKQKKSSINKLITKCNTRLNEVKLQEQKRCNISVRMQQLDEWLLQLDDDIAALQSTSTEVDDLLTSTQVRAQTTRDTVNRHRQHLNLLDTVKYIVSEEGVKSYIVNKILELFNNILAGYLRKMDANCLCYFNEYFEEEIINEKNKICSYFNFSGAERKNVDFACLFTFMDMRRLQGDVVYNISIYDELFDSSLDEKGVELVTNILKERVAKHNECVMVISHRKESIQHATGDVIFLEKQNGITRKIDYNPFTDN